MSSLSTDTHFHSELVREPLPAPLSRLGIFCGCAVFLSLGLTQLLAGSNDLHWTGNLTTHVEVVTAPFTSRIVSLNVDSGDSIATGEAIAELDSGSLKDDLIAQRRRVRHLELELAQAEAQAQVDLSWRLKSLDADIHLTKLKSADLLKEKFTSQMTDLAWTDLLTNSSFELANASATLPLLSDLPLPTEARIRAVLQQEAAHNAVEAYSTQIELCDSRLEKLEQLKGNLPEQIRISKGLPMLREQLAEARSETERIESQLEAITISSTVYGTAGLFRKREGDEVTAREPIVEILDRARQYVTVRIPTRSLPHFEAGMELTLSFPGSKPRLGRLEPIPPQTADLGERGESTIELSIVPIGKPWPEVPFGSTVDVSLPR